MSMKAWIVFSGQADMWWLRLLKPGFRHCSILLNDGEHWIGVDPLSSVMEIAVHKVPAQFDLPHWMRRKGHVVIPARPRPAAKPAPVGVFSCVEAAKRVLGIHNRFILTPWQLYRHVMKNQHIHNPDQEGAPAWEV